MLHLWAMRSSFETLKSSQTLNGRSDGGSFYMPENARSHFFIFHLSFLTLHSLPMRTLLLVLLCVFLTSCSSEQAQADFRDAMQYINGDGVQQNLTKGTQLLEKAAKAGNADAALTLGYFYAKGQNGVEKNVEKAQEYFLRAAKKGNKDAQYNVGLAYVRGDGVTVDFAEAVTWFTAAAQQNDAGAQYNLGVMHLQGEGVVADPLTAYAWFTLASENGFVGASDGQKDARHTMTDEQAKEIDATVERIRSSVKKTVQVQEDAGSMPL